MNKTKIEYGDYCWNPLEGCLHNCWYCYGERRFKQFGKSYKPKYYPERLKDPMKQKPGKVLVCFHADLFGDWVKKDFIQQVVDKTKEYPEHTFYFLTKNPKRYLEFNFPKNCWLGTTIDVVNQARLNYLKGKPDNFKFISFEPLLGDMSMLDLSGIDLVIVGAMTGMGENNVVPKKEWIDSIKHPNLFYKANIKQYLGG